MGNRSSMGMQIRAGIPALPPKDVKRPDVLQSSKWYEDQKTVYKDSAVFPAIQLRHKRLLNMLDAVHLKRSTVNPLLTSAANSVEVNNSIDKALKALDTPFKQNLAYAFDAVAAVDKQIAERTSLTEDQRSAEVRETLRYMSASKRREVLSAAIENKDTEVLGACLNGSSLLSGLTAKEQKSYKDRYVLAHAGELRTLQAATTKASDTLEKASFAMIDHLNSLRVEVASEEIRASGFANAAFEAELLNINAQELIDVTTPGF